MDMLLPENLKPGHKVKVTSPQGNQWQEVEEVKQVDEGVVMPIYSIKFKKSTFILYCNADREFAVEDTTPHPTPRGLFVP